MRSSTRGSPSSVHATRMRRCAPTPAVLHLRNRLRTVRAVELLHEDARATCHWSCCGSPSRDRIELVRQVVQAHAYWRMKGLTVELVVIGTRTARLSPGAAGPDHGGHRRRRGRGAARSARRHLRAPSRPAVGRRPGPAAPSRGIVQSTPRARWRNSCSGSWPAELSAALAVARPRPPTGRRPAELPPRAS